jgi:hypothetical protein
MWGRPNEPATAVNGIPIVLRAVEVEGATVTVAQASLKCGGLTVYLRGRVDELSDDVLIALGSARCRGGPP